MFKPRLAPVAGAVAALLAASNVHAQSAHRAWVSGHGSDAAGCGAPVAPCRSLQYAHDHIVAAGGEIDILDPAGYGAITISKAISIVNDGVGTAGVQSTVGNAITIAASVSDSVYLKGLNIDGVHESVATGIIVNSVGNLTVVDCVVRHFGQAGIHIVQDSGSPAISILNSVISDNADEGVWFDFASNPRVRLDHDIIDDDGIGFAANTIASPLKANISHSIFDNNMTGISLNIGEVNSRIFVDDSSLSFNSAVGIVAQSDAVIHLSRSVITLNAIGVTNSTTPSPGTFFTTGDNRLTGNTTDLTGLPLLTEANR